VNNRRLAASAEVGTGSPQELAQSLQAEIKKAGWHDIIFNSAGPEKAYLYFTQREMSGGKISKVRVTYWKAVKNGDQTHTERWVAVLKPEEVNDFLDQDFARVAMQFKVAKS
jgi:hypothetical protein